MLGTWNDMAPFGQQKRAKKRPKIITNANSSSVSAIYTVTPTAPHDEKCPDPHSISEVCYNTPNLPVPEHQSVSVTDHHAVNVLHDVYPATAKHTSQHRDVQCGGQHGAWSSSGGAGSGLPGPQARGVSDPSVSHSTATVHCTVHDVPRVPPTLLPDHISPLPGYG